MTKKVSVIMSTYNEEKYVSKAIDSILNQTFTDFEFIIINDGSTDNTGKILESYNDSRIKVFNQRNNGLTKSLNKAIKLSSGEYIARMDADDIAQPERLQKQASYLDSNPDIGMVGTANLVIDEQGKKIGEKIYPISDKKIKKDLIRYNPFLHASVMIRREVFDTVGLYNEKKIRGQDYELWFRIAERFKLANLPEILMMQRWRNNNISLINENEQYKISISTRLEAIKRRQYPKWSLIYLIKPYILSKSPFIVKKSFRKHLLRRKIYN